MDNTYNKMINDYIFPIKLDIDKITTLHTALTGYFETSKEIMETDKTHQQAFIANYDDISTLLHISYDYVNKIRQLVESLLEREGGNDNG